jgi:arsenate reductase
VEPEIVEYLKNPPGVDGMTELLDLLGMEPRQLMRKREKEYEENNLGDPDLTDEQLIQAMVDHPRLIERPIVIHGNRAILGRPTEKVLEVL